ncbi:hypothetical protein HNQ08_005078 [Deinococcus humi]|uniref:Uncharacterized protein n=1 Tax=Deinococcus humi TaxID=662880 RepID=A0A7W8JZ94_9DEIO|nr:hypothetical protein [Deinococcus humi]
MLPQATTGRGPGFGPEDGPKGKGSGAATGRPCLFHRFPSGHGGARRARRLFEAVRHRSQARRVCTQECKSGAPGGALLRGFPLPPQKQRIRVLTPVWVKLRHAASRRAHTSAVRAASSCLAAARRENGGGKQETTVQGRPQTYGGDVARVVGSAGRRGRHTRARRGRGVGVCGWEEMLCGTVKPLDILMK